ncbi:acetyl-CoA synthetase-like protein [Coleophoma cylindrospora]|uniref:Acetyl-CoA synthetase-like protein n=1 Tax=Coleophoma cylindrospora TaxID=1849047 RepID=A0A3D8RVB0_9HELO|nr:acetyl-CoA synthetase-like protein [Coleophoma cylindrospora]
MPYTSKHGPIDLPRVDILTYLFPPGETPSTKPLWIDSQEPEKNLSPAQLLRWVKRLAFGLERTGLKKGEVVMIYTPNHVFVPVAYLGIVGAGYAFSGANPIYTLPEMVHQINNTGAQIILAHPTMVATALAAAAKAGLSSERIYQFSDEFCPPCYGVPDWTSLIGTEAEGSTYSWPRLSAQEAASTVATINYSSGTTGLPKGVCVSHTNLIANIEQTIYMKYLDKPFWPDISKRPAERWIGFLPLYHAYGQLYTILMAVKLSVPVYIMKQFVYTDFLASIQKFKITHLQVAPPILVMLSKRPETAKYDISSVTDVLCGAAPLSKELQNDVMKRFGMQINQGWGMTEVTCGAIHVPGGVSDDTGSVGQLDPNSECKLLDDDGIEVPAGSPGEMYIRGPQVCLRYWKNEAATAESIDKDGWLKTGDVAVCDEREYFWIVDRKKELIKVNALQVAPAELEAVLLEHDQIADAAVVGITLHNEEWPRAYVALQDNAKGKVKPEDIQQWIKSKVAKHKWLVGGVTFINEVPKLASGKIQRKTMREWSKADAKILEGTVKSRF